MYAFYGCSNFKYLNDTYFPELLTIGKYAFYNCYNLNSITLGKVILVDYWAFAMQGVKAQKLTSVNMVSVKTIAEGAFISCAYLTTINMPNVEVVASNAFRECDVINLYLPQVEF
jgi:hypothetical protein